MNSRRLLFGNLQPNGVPRKDSQLAREFGEVWPLFDPLYADIAQSDESFFKAKPLLAHYTSMAVFEKVVENNEIWLSNPLLMNDIEEVRFGINEGIRAFLNFLREPLSEVGKFATIENGLLKAQQFFDDQHAFDTYIICFSKHQSDDQDGLLSMWRGYGDSGKGVAVVLDATWIPEADNTPLIIAKVQYGTAEERLDWFRGCAENFLRIVLVNKLDGQELLFAADALFSRLRVFSLFSKHKGFEEEQEWRLAYMPERDSQKFYLPMLSYFNGPKGVEPKLKLKVSSLSSVAGDHISLENLVSKIILGPTLSSPIAIRSAKRMLTSMGRSELAEKVTASRIPFRP